MNQSEEPKVRIGQVFVSSVKFKHREDALRLSPRTEVDLSFAIDIEVKTAKGGEQGFIRIGLETKKDKAEDPLYSIRVEMIGIVKQEAGAQDFSAQNYLISSGAFMMYPFMREFIANLTARARFGPVWLKPMNFNALTDQMQASIDRETKETVDEG